MSIETREEALLPLIRKPPMTLRPILAVYLLLALIPWALSYTQGLEIRNWYTELVSLLTIVGMVLLLAQFVLTGRINAINYATGVDHAMFLHRKAGEILALLFFLHPFLIHLPRFFIAPELALNDLWLMFVDSESRTGLFAWALLCVWVLMSMFRDKLGMKYEMWRYSHALGFVAMIVLATHHAVTVGRHGRYNIWFDLLWVALCAIAVGAVIYTYFIRPAQVAKKPFKVKDCQKVGKDDWYLTVEKDGEFAFNFDAGQFCWLNATESIYNRAEHPFSIASSPAALPSVSFLVRDLGDFTSKLGERLEPGRRVYLDGPHGVFTLTARKARGIGLIAGGAGIGPILGILRQLRDIKDSRPIRLIYGNRTMDQMVFQDEIKALEAELEFDQTLVLLDPPPEFDGYKGVIDLEILDKTFTAEDRDAWDYFVCGPPVMVDAVAATLKDIGIPEKRILFERLGY